MSIRLRTITFIIQKLYYSLHILPRCCTLIEFNSNYIHNTFFLPL
ncbi:hypothetical protein EXW33_00065 [Bacillus toyonensis]|nr:hypothetical protein EXW33_00065 [Bacillus toyonensis]